MKNLTWQNPEQLFVAQELINKVKSKCCGIKDITKIQNIFQKGKRAGFNNTINECNESNYRQNSSFSM